MRGSNTKHPRTSRRPACERLEARTLCSADLTPYAIGTPNLTALWVDPIRGSDTDTGATRDHALHGLGEAWNRVPANITLTSTGYAILLASGDYSADLLPANGWTSDRHGTYSRPVMIAAADGVNTVRLHGDLNCQNDDYLYLVGLNFVTDPGASGGGNVLQLASDDHVLVAGCVLNGFNGTVRTAQETLKANQCQYLYVESCDIQGAFWFGLDFVAVQYGHVLANHIHSTGDDGVVLKGGTANITVARNTVDNIGNIGLAAGQGTGFEFMAAPWIHYEAYDLKFIDNIVHDTQNAGMAVRGGYNILIADNTLYKVGQSAGPGSSLILLSPGGRTCDGDAAAATIRHNLGGWGPAAPGDGGEWIPNQNVTIANNLFDNPAGFATMWDDLDIFAPITVPAYTNIPSPVLSDGNFVFTGNLIWNGSAVHPVFSSDAGREAVFRASNTIGVFEPQLVNPSGGDFRPAAGGNLSTMGSASVTDFLGNDRPLTPRPPLGDLSNAVLFDAISQARTLANMPGAFILAGPRLFHRSRASRSAYLGDLRTPPLILTPPDAVPPPTAIAPKPVPIVTHVHHARHNKESLPGVSLHRARPFSFLTRQKG